MSYPIKPRHENQNFPVPYGITPAGHRAINEHGPFCDAWTDDTYAGKTFRRPCLLPREHRGRHNPRGGRSRQ